MLTTVLGVMFVCAIRWLKHVCIFGKETLNTVLLHYSAL